MKRRRRKNPFKVLLGWVFVMVLALVFALVLRTYVFTLVQTTSVAMNDVIQSGDVVVMTRFDYWLDDPERGDIVAFIPNGETAVTFRRIIAVPGDSVEFKAGVVYLNGEELREDYAKDVVDQSFQPTILPMGYYMLLGDNRAQSLDSRDERIGLVAKSQIEGRVRYVIWPADRIGAIE